MTVVAARPMFAAAVYFLINTKREASYIITRIIKTIGKSKKMRMGNYTCSCLLFVPVVRACCSFVVILKKIKLFLITNKNNVINIILQV